FNPPARGEIKKTVEVQCPGGGYRAFSALKQPIPGSRPTLHFFVCLRVLRAFVVRPLDCSFFARFAHPSRGY
ncbi:MAG: hypothetical protein ACREVW_04795, partial [Burkholderiales bacterium]